MICECEKLKQGSFKTEKDYIFCQQKVNEFVSKDILEKLGEREPDGTFFSVGYSCLKCSKKWRLNTPDQAYRGGWFENK
jgi:hypothetical protein